MFIRFDPDEWRPTQARLGTTTGRLEAGTIIVWQRQPYRVIEVRERAHADWPEKYRAAWVKHGMPDPDSWPYRPRVLVLKHEDQPQAKRINIQGPNSACWHTLPEHYSICRLCHELPPCRHEHNESILQRASERMSEEMAILPGTCHGCREPITRRQKSFAFPGANLTRPDLGDDSAVFHTRATCRDALNAYDKRWANAETGRTRFFYCDGMATVHHDGTVECDSPSCTAKGAMTELVNHKARVWHHPEGSRDVQGCWCLAGATLPGI